jgi:phenylacetate-coenzyme A ligase PaaK-like adenylate-forming protein/ubiquinone/menaquinone biosynthesis C-methylase UbiE
MNRLEQKGNLTKLLLTSSAYRQSNILTSAIELNLFSALSKGLRTVPEIASEIGVSERGTEKLLGGLIAIQLIEKMGTFYKNTITAETYLVPNKDLYLGDGMLFLKSLGEKTWSTLTPSLKAGHPVANQRTDEPNAEFWRKLTRAIRPLSHPVAESVFRILRAVKPSNAKMLDLAGGSGIFGQKFLQTFPEGVSLQVDWPGTNEIAIQFAEGLGVKDRFLTENGNLLEGKWTNGSYDIVVLSHFLHQESKENSIELLSKIKRCLRPDGYLIINEYCLNPEKTATSYGLIFALSMALQNQGGDSYSLQDYGDWVEQLEFSVEMIYSPLPPATVLIARLRQPDQGKNYFASVKSYSIKKEEMSYQDSFWDFGEKSTVKTSLLQTMNEQLHFAYQKVDFWKKRLPNELLKKEILTHSEIEMIPILTKNQIWNLSPYDLVPDSKTPFFLFRGTGGTTGRPFGVFWSQADWNAAIEAATRYLQNLKSIQPLIVWNGYHQAHVSGPAFDDIIRKLGGTPIPRHFRSTDLDALEEIKRIQANAIVITPRAGSGKGGSLEDLLAIDPDFIKKRNIRALLVSSTPLEKEIVEEVKSQGVEQIYNFYGSTEAFPSAVSCASDPTVFHLCQGHLYVEVVNDQGQQVKSGETGMILVSRIGSSSPSGRGVNEGTQLFRYLVGDSATFLDEPCSCGKNTPRIFNIARVKNIEEKIRGGCERWE